MKEISSFKKIAKNWEVAETKARAHMPGTLNNFPMMVGKTGVVPGLISLLGITI